MSIELSLFMTRSFISVKLKGSVVTLACLSSHLQSTQQGEPRQFYIMTRSDQKVCSRAWSRAGGAV